MENRNIQIGCRIKELRKTRGLTQKKLGEAIGRTESLVAQYEKGKVEIPLSIMEELAKALDEDFNYLLHGKRYQGTLNLDNATPEDIDKFVSMVKTLPDRIAKGSSYLAEVHSVLKSYNITMEDFLSLTEEHEALLDKYGLTPAQFSEMVTALNRLGEESTPEK